MSDDKKLIIGVTIEDPSSETGRPRMLAQMEVEVPGLSAWGIYSDALKTLLTPSYIVVEEGEAPS